MALPSTTGITVLILAALGVLWFVLQRGAKPGLGHAEILALKQQGALVLDVRSEAEFRQGHVPGSLNLPLGSLGSRLGELPRERAILTVCASGMRSGMARRQLLEAGFKDVHNAGPWQVLR